MIIKFLSGLTWVVFGEIDHIEYGEIEPSEISPEAIVYDIPNNNLPSRKQVGIGFFTKNMNEATQVVAYPPIYIMNDQGQTVETI